MGAFPAAAGPGGNYIVPAACTLRTPPTYRGSHEGRRFPTTQLILSTHRERAFAHQVYSLGWLRLSSVNWTRQGAIYFRVKLGRADLGRGVLSTNLEALNLTSPRLDPWTPSPSARCLDCTPAHPFLQRTHTLFISERSESVN